MCSLQVDDHLSRILSGRRSRRLWCGFLRNGNPVVFDADLQLPDSDLVLLFMPGRKVFRIFEKNEIRPLLYASKIVEIVGEIKTDYCKWVNTEDGSAATRVALKELESALAAFPELLRNRHQDYLMGFAGLGCAELVEADSLPIGVCCGCGKRFPFHTRLRCSACQALICSCGACRCGSGSNMEVDDDVEFRPPVRASSDDEYYEIQKELEEYRFNFSRSEEEGWFYPDD